MIQPIELQIAHFKVDQVAQATKSAIAAAQQTAQGKEMVQESVKRDQMVQAGAAAAEAGKVKRREEEEGRERRRENHGQKKSSRSEISASSEISEAVGEPAGVGTDEIKVKKTPKSFELYA